MKRAVERNHLRATRVKASQLERRLHRFGPRIGEEYRVGKGRIDDLLRESDIVTLHAPFDATTHHLICDRTLALMKREAVLINCARGELVDEAAWVKLRDRFVEMGKLPEKVPNDPKAPVDLNERLDDNAAAVEGGAEVAAKPLPDLDLELPDMDGLEVLRILRGGGFSGSILVLSDRSDGATVLEDVQALLVGVVDGVGRRGQRCATACAVASFQAIQPSRAHLMRAGYLETPSNATASSSTSSRSSVTASVSPLALIRVRNAS